MKERYFALLPILFVTACFGQDPTERPATSSGTGLGVATAVMPGSFAAPNQASIDRSEANPVARKSRPDGDVDAPPGYPQRTDTGNSVLDDAGLQEEKQRWMIEHPEEYRAYLRALHDRTPSPHE